MRQGWAREFSPLDSWLTMGYYGIYLRFFRLPLVLAG